MNLEKSVPHMCNEELIGLAKNRFIDSATQMAIAKTGYRRGLSYLCENPALNEKVAELLWSFRGYTLKCELLFNGHFDAEPEKWRELYYEHGSKMMNRSPWRLHSTLLSPKYWCRYGTGGRTAKHTACPPDIIEDIMRKRLSQWKRTEVSPPSTAAHESYYYSRQDMGIVEHPNTPEEILVIISASHPNERTRNAAFLRLGKK